MTNKDSLPPDSPLQANRDFEAGDLSRDDYWLKMQQFHLILQDYSKLVEKADLERLEIEASELRILLKNGLYLRWVPQDIRTAPNVLINNGAYEAKELAVINKLIGPGQVIFDIGANIGWYSLHLAQRLGESGGTVYSFEPVPQTFTELEQNIELNDLRDIIKAHNLAFGESAGSVQFYLPQISGSVAASVRPLFPEDANHTVECRVMRLDDFVSEQQIQQVDFVKCDVEGAELLVLRGAVETISKHMPVIMLELLRKWAKAFNYHPNDIIALLRELGYRGYYEEGGFIEITEMTDDCTETNFFFFHESKHNTLLEELQGGSIA